MTTVQLAMRPMHPDLVTTLYNLETELHKDEVRSCPNALETLLSDSFVEFGSSGQIFNKQEIINALCRETNKSQAVVEDFTTTRLADGVELVTYKSTIADGGIQKRTLRSSIWERRDGAWRMVFHQGTRIP